VNLDVKVNVPQVVTVAVNTLSNCRGLRAPVSNCRGLRAPGNCHD
jgi:hypothetical protein